jgi:hypothetical protein
MNVSKLTEISLPPAARALSTLPRIDYCDAHLIALDPADGRTAEQLARVIFEDAPVTLQASLMLGWLSLGFRMRRPHAPGATIGWPIKEVTDERVLLASQSRLGLAGELLILRQRNSLLFSALVQQRNAFARALWAAILPRVHRPVERTVLEGASALIASR